MARDPGVDSSSSTTPFPDRPNASASPATVNLQPGEQLGEFHLLRQLGQGGMGQVWEVQQASLDRKVALKLINPGSAVSDSLERFTREARAGGRLSHPNIVSVYSHGHSEGVEWIAMELVEGGRTLHDLIEEQRALESPDGDHNRHSAELVAQLADALGAAHAASVIHRDVKPRNVLLTPAGVPKLTDFGLARLLDEASLTRTSSVAGTYAYMSPEQIKAEAIKLDHRSDVFSLGVVLYELLALRRPFEGDSFEQVMTKILLLEPVPLRQSRSRIPMELETITAKAMSKDPRHRYASMEEFAADLRRFLAHEPIQARPPGRVLKARMWMRRHPTLSAVYLLGSSALVVVSFLLVHLSIAQAEANKEAETARLIDEFFGDELIEAMRPSADPERGKGVLLEDAVTTAARNLGGRFADRPLVEAGIRFRLGSSYESLANYEEAELQFERAAELYGQALGSSSEKTLESRAHLASTLKQLSRFQEVEPMLQELKKLVNQTLGPAHPVTLDVLHTEASVLYRLGDPDAAEEVLRDVMDVTYENHGEESAQLADQLHTMTSIEVSRGNFAEAMALAERALSIERVVGDVGGVTHGLANLANTHRMQGRHDQAIEMLTECLEVGRPHFGPTHLLVLSWTSQLGRSLAVSSQFEEAEATLRQALEEVTTHFGENHQLAHFTRDGLMELYGLQGKFEEALAVMIDIVGAVQEQWGEDSLEALQYQGDLGGLLEQLGRLDEAEQAYLRGVEGLRSKLPETHPIRLWVVGRLGRFYSSQGRQDEALPLLLSLYEVTSEQQGPHHPQTLQSLGTLMACMRQGGQASEADELGSPVFEGARQALEPGSPELLQVRGELYAARMQAGRQELALPLLHEMVLAELTLAADASVDDLRIEAIATFVHNHGGARDALHFLAEREQRAPTEDPAAGALSARLEELLSSSESGD